MPTLIPILVYQGPGDWPGPYLLSELSHLPDEPAPPVHVDLRMTVHALRDDSLAPSELTTLARITFRLLRLAALEQLVVANAARIAGWLEKVHDAHGYADYRALMEYIASAGKDTGMIEAIIGNSREDVKEEAMSTADWIHERGRARGKVELLLALLEQRFGALPLHVESKVLSATPQQVDEWALRVLSAASLAEVLGER